MAVGTLRGTNDRTVLSSKVQDVLTNWSGERRRCDVEELSSDDSNTGGEGNDARDEVYNDKKVEAGSEASQNRIHFEKWTNLDY